MSQELNDSHQLAMSQLQSMISENMKRHFADVSSVNTKSKRKVQLPAKLRAFVMKMNIDDSCPDEEYRQKMIDIDKELGKQSKFMSMKEKIEAAQ